MIIGFESFMQPVADVVGQIALKFKFLKYWILLSAMHKAIIVSVVLIMLFLIIRKICSCGKKC